MQAADAITAGTHEQKRQQRVHQASQPREHHLKTEASRRPQMREVRFTYRRRMLSERIGTHSIHA